jgi:hypothetical protein
MYNNYHFESRKHVDEAEKEAVLINAVVRERLSIQLKFTL